MSTKPLKPTFLPVTDIISAAEAFRQKYSGNTIPVPIEMIVERDLGINIDPVSGLRDSIRSDAYLCSDFLTLKVDLKKYMDERYENRLRFSYAHEMGHYVLHRDIYKKISFDSIDEYLDFYAQFDDRDYRSFEWQANLFAGNLLVPEKELISKLDEVRAALTSSMGLGSFSDTRDVYDAFGPSLARYFAVSEETMERRVCDLHLWPFDKK